jgi:hypothetical protein
MTRLVEHIRGVALQAAEDAIKSGAFDDAITAVIIDQVRAGRDDGLTRTGFILKMAVEMIDRSTPKIGLRHAQCLAVQVHRAYCRDNKIEFGKPGWGWGGSDARAIAHEYEIDFWECQP